MNRKIHLTYSFLLKSLDSNSQMNNVSTAADNTAASSANVQSQNITSFTPQVQSTQNTNGINYTNNTSTVNRHTGNLNGSTSDSSNKVVFGQRQPTSNVQSSLNQQKGFKSLFNRQSSINVQQVPSMSSNSSASSNTKKNVSHNVGMIHSLSELNQMKYGDVGIYQGLRVSRIHSYRYFRILDKVPVYSQLIFSKLNKVVDLPDNNLTALIYRAFKVENSSKQAEIRFELSVGGNTYFIKDDSKLVQDAYVHSNDISTSGTSYIEITKPIYWYKLATLKQPITQLQPKTKIAVKKVIPLDDHYQSATCLETKEGYYITGNTNYIKLI